MVAVCQDPTSRAFSGVLDGIPGGHGPCLSLGVTNNTTKSPDFGKTAAKFRPTTKVRGLRKTGEMEVALEVWGWFCPTQMNHSRFNQVTSAAVNCNSSADHELAVSLVLRGPINGKVGNGCASTYASAI
jgi:hypothetical protein